MSRDRRGARKFLQTRLPDPLILTGYVHVGAERIERLIIIHNRDVEV